MKKVILILFAVFFSINVFAAEKEKYYAPTLTSNFILYIMDPESVAGWSSILRAHEKKFMPEKYKTLPILGGWRDGGIPDKEMLAKIRVKKAFVITSDDMDVTERIADLKKAGIDVVTIKADKIRDYIPLLRQLGKTLGVPERGEALAKYGEKSLAKTEEMLKGLPEDKKERVFFGTGPDALTTYCNNEVLAIAGGKNAHKCVGGAAYERVNFEQIMMDDPDAIVVVNPDAADKIRSDAKWKRLRAYKEGKLYIVPYGPFGWMHLPEVTRFIGIPWLTCKLYPDRCAINIDKETKIFTKLFMHADLTDAQVDEIHHRNKK